MHSSTASFYCHVSQLFNKVGQAKSIHPVRGSANKVEQISHGVYRSVKCQTAPSVVGVCRHSGSNGQATDKRAPADSH